MTGLNKEHFSILLTHNPIHWRQEVIPSSDIELTFSGHTHGMQLRIGNYSPAQHRYNDWGGIYKENEQTLIVNNGLGYTVIPIRLGALPQIYVINLKTKQN